MSYSLEHSTDGPAFLEIDDAIATITLNRAEAFNAMDIDMAARLESLALAVEDMANVRVLVIRGSGKAFCAGGDINLFVANISNPGPPIRALLAHLNRFLVVLRRMDKLVLTSVHGAIAGAGFSMAFMGDFCIAAANSRFRPSYAQIGVSPDAGGTIGLVQTLGPRRALQIFLDEQELSCERADELGLLSRIVPPEELAEKTHEYAKHLARLSKSAVAETKRLVWLSGSVAMEQQLAEEAKAIVSCMETDEFKNMLTRMASR